MKIWSKGFDNAPEIDAFTVGKDRELDLMLAPWDILGTMAHITMLSEVGLLGKDELIDHLKNQIILKDERIDRLMSRVDVLIGQLDKLLTRCDHCAAKPKGDDPA